MSFGMDAQVLIQNGELIMGTLCKKTLGASEGSLIHVIWIDKGPEAARAFLSQTQYTVNYWLLQNSCSIGLGDTVADDATRETIKELIDKVIESLLAYCIYVSLYSCRGRLSACLLSLLRQSSLLVCSRTAGGNLTAIGRDQWQDGIQLSDELCQSCMV